MEEWVCGKCRSVNLKFATSCYSCATPRRLAGEMTLENATFAPVPQASPPATITQFGPLPPASTLAGGGAGVGQLPLAPASGPLPGTQPVMSSLLGGVGLGLAASAVATLLWYGVVALSGWQIGFVAIGVGWLVGTGTVLGARGGVSLLLVASSGLFTFLALVVSEYLIVLHFVSEALGIALVDLLRAPELMPEIVFESVTADPLTLVFWAIALFASVSIPFRALTSPQ